MEKKKIERENVCDCRRKTCIFPSWCCNQKRKKWNIRNLELKYWEMKLELKEFKRKHKKLEQKHQELQKLGYYRKQAKQQLL